jgi:hypothetical protein
MLEQQRESSGFSLEVLASEKNWVEALLESTLRAGLEEPNQEPDSATE